MVPKDVLVKKGTAARFDCVYQSADVLEWYFKETGPLENSTRYEQNIYSSLIVGEVLNQLLGLLINF